MSDKAKEYFKEWGTVCRIARKSDCIPITYDQIIDLMQSYADQELKDVLKEVENYAKETEEEFGDNSAYWHYKNLLNHIKQRKG